MHLIERLLARHLQLALQMKVGNSKKSMDTRPLCPFQSAPCPLNIRQVRAGKPGDHGPVYLGGDPSHRPELFFGSDGKAGFDNIDAELVQLPGQAKLVFCAHTATGRLFAVTQSSVEDGDLRPLHKRLLAEEMCSIHGHGVDVDKSNLLFFLIVLAWLII